MPKTKTEEVPVEEEIQKDQELVELKEDESVDQQASVSVSQKTSEPVNTDTPVEDDPLADLDLQRKKGFNDSFWGKEYHPFLFLVIMLIISAFLIGGMYLAITLPWEQFTASQSAKTPTPVEKQSSVSATPTPEAGTSAQAKEDLQIQILNGSGVVGQAAKVKDMLAKQGFKNIKTSNSDEDNVEITKVLFALDVPKSIRAEIKKTLEEVFSQVEEDDLGKDEKNLDIQITTGTGLL